jgi:succinylglutamate desuccinylase
MSFSTHAPRILGHFKGETPGPLILVIGALHGNEPAGVKALELVFEALEQAQRDDPAFQFKGTLLGMIGNLQAFLIRHRFIEQDLNRVWTDAFLETSLATPDANLKAENLEVVQLFDLISNALQENTATQTVLLDLHTTSAEGGVFCIPTDEGDSLELARHLGAPAILGLHSNINGNLLGFAKAGGFTTPSIAPLCIAFEAGQHESQRSVSRAAFAIVRCLRVMGNVESHDLLNFSEGLALPIMTGVPPIVRFKYAHHIKAEDQFKMRPGYANFQPILKGEHLADDVNGPVLSPDKGLILMPLYQAKGSDGFFIVQ